MATEMGGHRLGWIGLGRMGLPLVERLARAGADIAAYNRTRAKARPLEAAGIEIVDRPVDLADRDVVFVMVSADDDLEQVTLGPGGVLADPDRAPRVLVDCSTVSPGASAKVRAAVEARDSRFLVVPVSGNDRVARAGKLALIASGPREAFDEVAPYLAALGRSVRYLGEGDQARGVKICHNLLLGIVFQGLAEVTVLAEKQGVPRHRFLEFINGSILGSLYTGYRTPGIVNLDFAVTFTQSLLRKDLDLGLELARASGATLPLTGVVRDLVQEAIDAGEADSDYTTLFLRQAEASGLEPEPEGVDVPDGLAR